MKKRILILNQTLNDTFMNMYRKIIEEFGTGVILTGSYLNSQIGNLKIVKAPQHDASNVRSRFKCWVKYINFVHKWINQSDEQFDVVFVFTNPPIAPLYAWYLNKIKKWPYVIQVWDIYPEVVERSIHKKLLTPIYAFWRKLNVMSYHKAEAVITLGNNMAETIRKQSPKN